MKRTSISLQVIMAGKYDFEVGKKVNFRLDPETKLYMVSSEQLEFGLAKSLVRGKREELKSLGNDFSGIVIQSSPETMRMMVKVFTGNGHDGLKEGIYDTGRSLLGRTPVKKRVWRELEGDCAALGNPGADKLCWT
ncbi:hypothetical protein QMP26_34235 [Enterocloster clostridioformis]|uniref:hypothetical protein n=1 Tax=Enterocloster clostridioformis TaxID=1531 RepID=UPI0026752860|nr:hypothetical protein [Enterocloster clostridioformis]